MEPDKAEDKTKTGGLLGFLSHLSSSGLTIIGVLYVIGYVIVNGYQTKYLHYSSNALQLKHIAAGALYTFLTLIEVLVMTTCLVDGFVDWRDRLDARNIKRERQRDSKMEAAKPRSFWSRIPKPLDSGNPVLSFLEIWGQAFSKAGALLALVFTIIGVAVLPGSPALRSSLKYFLGWTGINLLVSLFLSYTLYKFHRRQFEEIFKKVAQPEKKEAEPSAEQAEPFDSWKWFIETRRSFIERGAEKVSTTLGLMLCGLFSLVLFQGLYGRLNPDYGGGALYRVALSVGSESKLPEDVRQALQAQGTWLLLVDRDDKSVHLLLVDQSGGKRLFQIEASQIAALEVLPTAPVFPDDVAYALQHPAGAGKGQ